MRRGRTPLAAPVTRVSVSPSCSPRSHGHGPPGRRALKVWLPSSKPSRWSAADDAGVADHVAAHHEERGRHPQPPQLGCDARRPARVWPVIEGQRDPPPTRPLVRRQAACRPSAGSDVRRRDSLAGRRKRRSALSGRSRREALGGEGGRKGREQERQEAPAGGCSHESAFVGRVRAGPTGRRRRPPGLLLAVSVAGRRLVLPCLTGCRGPAASRPALPAGRLCPRRRGCRRHASSLCGPGP